ncbi:MAG: SpoIVB peptidase [Oscillospiraceae bacterium]
MGRFVKSAAAALGTVTMGIMGLVGFYSASLPDFYYVQSGEGLTMNTAFSISSKPTQRKVQEVNWTEGISEMLTASSDPAITKVSDSTLMLFGSVPIKEVKTGEMTRPLLVPCGQPFGIKLMTDGVMVIRLEKIDGCCPAVDCGIRVGDIITEVDGENVTTNKKISEIISGSKGKPCTVSYLRDGEEKTATLSPVYSEGSYKAGIWVRDSSAGIGTMTFYDPETGAFGGLGHPICDADTKLPLPLSHGTVGEVNITGCNKSCRGEPGQLLGEFSSSAAVGDITANDQSGIFGILNSAPVRSKAVELGFRQEVHTGKAYIYSTIDGCLPAQYEISIEKLDLSDDAEHHMIVRITDPELLEKTGGIVQGMSGSPIIQDGRLVGAVTHVFVDDPTQGYGIFADEMYRQAAKCEKTDFDLAG